MQQPQQILKVFFMARVTHVFTLANLIALLATGYDWKALPKGSVVVDVGGGVGSVTKVLVKAHPHLKFIIQDRPTVIADGLKVSEGHVPWAYLTAPLGMEGAFS